MTVSKINRRALLRGATASVPAILTLHSGAALARTSNLLGAAADAGAPDGKYRCLDLDGVAATEKPYVYDVGSPPMAHVTRIDADARYFRSNPDSRWGGWYQDRNTEISKPKMCADGGSFYRKDRYRTTEVNVKRGVLVSATALSSFSSGISYTDV